MTSFIHSIPALLCAIAFAALPVSAQIQQDPPITCTSDNGTPLQVRSGGVTELLGDIVLNCTGGVPTPDGQPIPKANIRVELQVPWTSRVFADGTSEALLIIDEPFPADPFPSGQTPVGGSSTPQKFCVANSVSNCSLTGTGGATNPYAGTINVFQGVSTNGGRYLDFWGVPIDPPGNTVERVIRITNLRADVSSLAFSNMVQAAVWVSGNASLVLPSPYNTVAFVYDGMVPAPNCAYEPTTHVAGCPGSASQINVGAMEGFARSFKTAVATSKDGAAQGGLTSLRTMPGGTIEPQNLMGIGINYYTESSMTISASPSPFSGSGIGEANHGTWVMVSLTNIPAGVRISAPGSVQGYSHDDWPNTPDNPSLLLYRVDVPPGGWQFNSSFYSSAPADKVVVDTTGVNPPTSANIVYEVVTDDPNMEEYFKIPFAVSAQPGVSIAGITKRVMLAPVPEAPIATGAESTWEQPSTTLDIPRFLDGVPTVSPGLAVSGIYALGQTLTADFTITNPTAGDFTFQKLGLSSPAGGPQFATLSNLTLGPGQSYHYVSTQQINTSGTFVYAVQYQRLDGTWVTNVPSDVASVTVAVSAMYSLSLHTTGKGTLTANPPPALNGKYAAGSYVCLTAAPDAGYLLSSWSGTALDGNHCLTMNANASVTANFVNSHVTLALSVLPARSGNIVANPVGSNGVYTVGTKICLTAKPSTGYYFVSWSGATLDSHNCFTILANTSVKATFSKPVMLAVVVSPASSGSVSVKPSPTRGMYIPGTKVCLTATAKTGYVFSSWSGARLDANNCFNLTANTKVTAKFVKGLQLTLKASPTSGGTVTAAPASAKGYYAPRTKVCLTATPKSGFRFGSWSGTRLDSSNCFTITANTAVTARFVKP